MGSEFVISQTTIDWISIQKNNNITILNEHCLIMKYILYITYFLDVVYVNTLLYKMEQTHDRLSYDKL